MEQHKLECEYNVCNEHFYRIHHDDVERCKRMKKKLCSS